MARTPPPLGQLLFEVFVAVDAQLGLVRKVGTKLQEERAEVLVHTIEIEKVDHGGGVVDPRHGAFAARRPEAFAHGAGHGGLLLGDADEDHAFAVGELRQPRLHDIVLALPFGETHDGDVEVPGKGEDAFTEGIAHGDGVFGRGEPVALVVPEIGGDTRRAGQLWHIGVEIHSVDGLELVADVFLLEIGDGMRHGECGVRLGLCYTIPAIGTMPAP